MFGYITIDRDELKGKDFDRYREYYCGVCRDLKNSCGERARMTLTYDMTFLAILLNALYEGSAEVAEERCILHPTKKQKVIRNEYTAYAADMNLLLVYHNLMDDWLDEKSVKSLAAAKALRSAYVKTASRYPRQTKAIRTYLKELHETEESGSTEIDRAAGLTGRLMAEIYSYRKDEWQDELSDMGFCIGKFIYLCDAWDDIEKDLEKGCYNPFKEMAGDEDFDQKAGQILTMQAAGAARAFERLPILRDVDILRNILYSGIWVKYRAGRAKKAENTTRETP